MKKLLFENDGVRIELQDGIIIAIWKSSLVDLNVAQQAIIDRLEATNFIPYPMIVNIKSIKRINKAARDFLASEKGCEGIIAAALLINSSVGRMLGNFFIQINKPLRPTKIFTDEKMAKKWLIQYVK